MFPSSPELSLVLAVKATIVLAAAGLASLALRRASASTRHLVWVLAFAGLLALPMLTRTLPAWRAPIPVTLPAVPATAAEPPAASAPDAQSPVPWLAIAWAVGAVVPLGRLLVALARLARLSARARPLSAEGGVRVRESAGIRTPMTWGALRPVILLPESARQWSAARLRVVLAHERAHVRRQDWLTRIVAQAAAALYWFHPLAWVALGELRKESERAADDAVLRSGEIAPDYAGHLLEIAKSMGSRSPLAAAGIAMAQPSGLEWRLAALLDPRVRRHALTRRGLAGAALVAALLLAPLAAVTAWAQSDGVIAGLVFDPSGGVVPRARVTVSSLESPRTEIAETDEAGQFAVKGLPYGRYGLEIARPGFARLERKDIVLRQGEARVYTYMLELGRVAETVSVVAKRSGHAVAPAATAGPRRIKVGGDVQATRLVRMTRPAYPERAKQLGIEGTVLMRAVIGKDGSLLNLSVLNQQVDAELSKAALDAVSQWRYQPTLLNGEPVEVITTVTVNFRLEE
jgi:TonB family protein